MIFFPCKSSTLGQGLCTHRISLCYYKRHNLALIYDFLLFSQQASEGLFGCDEQISMTQVALQIGWRRCIDDEKGFDVWQCEGEIMLE